MFKDSVKLTGRLLIQKFNENKELVFSTEVPNLVVTSGKEFIASRIVAGTLDPMGYMAIGDDASVGALSQTTLVNELARVTVTSATASGSNVTFTATFPAGTPSGSSSIVEAGVFNQDDSSVIVFEADNDVDSGSHQITYVAHGFTTGDKVTYTDGGGTVVGGLIDGGTYYIIRVDADTIKLATTYSLAVAGTAIGITDGVGANHKLTYGTMLCRTTFPVITKSSSETIAISWVVSVG